MCRLFYTENFNTTFANKNMLEKYIRQLEISNGGHGDGVLIIEPENTEPFEQEHNWIGLISKLSDTEYVVKTTVTNPNREQSSNNNHYNSGSLYPYGYNYSAVNRGVFATELAEFLWQVKPKKLFFHTRLASAGSKSIENIHPQIGERFILFQNGTIRFPDMTYKAFGLKPSIDSDTKLISVIINTLANNIKQAGEILIEDTSTFLVWDRIAKEALVVNNNRDLVYVEDLKLFASEPPAGIEATEFKMSMWLNGEFAVKEEKPKITRVTTTTTTSRTTTTTETAKKHEDSTEYWTKTAPLSRDRIKYIEIRYKDGVTMMSL